MQVMNVILTGYRCTGKTAVGGLLAKMSGRLFFDTDELVCRRTGKTIAGIIADEGWMAFRKEEHAVIEEVCRLDGVVIATGGGAILDPANVQCFKKNGWVIWLVASAETIRKRMENDASSRENRPPLSDKTLDEEVRESLAEREPLYRLNADMVVTTDTLDEKEAAAAIFYAMP
jgi:shikimate kinase